MSEQLIYRGEVARSAENKTLDELKAELDGARAHWAKISAKRQNRLFDRRIEGYNAAKQNYNTLVAEYGRQSLADKIAQAQDTQERNVIALGYIVDMQNQLRAETDKISDGKRRRKFGRAIGKFLTTGSKATQFAKSAAISMVAGAVGGVVGASVVTLAAMRFAKGYVTSEVSGLGTTDTSAYHEDFMHDEDSDTLIERAQSRSAEIFEIAGVDQQNKKRAAVRRGLGAMTVGFVVGGTIGSLIDGIDMPSAHATPIIGTTHESPGLTSYDSSGYDSPGISAQTTEYASPGVESTSYASPGVSEIQPTAEFASPGLSATEAVYANPGLSDIAPGHPDLTSADYANPGLVDTNGEYASPGLHGGDVASPPLVDGGAAHDTYESPGLSAATDTKSPDLDMNESHYENPGLIADNSDGGDHTPTDSAEHFKLDKAFTVQHGHGYVHEIMDAAKANDIKLTPSQAWEIHKSIVDKVGTDYIDLLHHSGDDTYSMGTSDYETGIAAPGKAEWDPRAIDMLHDKFAALNADGHEVPSDHYESPNLDVDNQHSSDAHAGNDTGFSSGAEHIGEHEGFYHELGQMGVDPDHQPEVLDRAADSLYDQGAAYEMSDGLPGINMTTDHMMTPESLETLHQAAIDSNVSDDLTVTHENIVFDKATDAASTTTTDNSEFLVKDFGKSYDVDAQSYYDALSGVDRAQWQTLLNEAAPKLQSVKYGGEALTYRLADGWHFREVDELPSSAVKILAGVASKHNWTLAS